MSSLSISCHSSICWIFFLSIYLNLLQLSSWPKYLSSPDVSTLFFRFKNVLCKTFPLSLVYSFELNIAFALESILRSRVSCVLFILLLITVNEWKNAYHRDSLLNLLSSSCSFAHTIVCLYEGKQVFLIECSMTTSSKKEETYFYSSWFFLIGTLIFPNLNSFLLESFSN